MKVVLTVLVLVTTLELVLGVPVYGPPQPLPTSHKYRSPNGAPIPAKYSPHPSGHSGKNEFYSKFNPHSLPPGLRGPAPQLPPPFAKYPHLPPPGKHQQQYQQQNQHQHQQQHQHHHHQQQQQQHQQQPHHPPNSLRPLGPQFQSKPHLLQNGASHHSSQQNQVNSGPEQRVQLVPSRPTSKITNVWTGPKLSGSPDFSPHFPAASNPVAPATAAPFPEKPRGPYIINSDDERGPIKTIPAPNLNPADKPANFEEQLYRAQHQQSYVQPLDNSITDEKLSYQVTEVPSGYKPFNSQPSYFAQDLGPISSAKVPSNTEPNSIPTVPLDIALQQHLDNQHQQQLSAEHIGSTDTLTPQELYSLLNGNQAAAAAAAVVPQTTYMVPQTVMYAVPQPQSLDLQVGHQLQYQAPPVQLQYSQQPAATGVQLQYAQPAAADLQYLQPQTVQYQPQAVQYQPQAVQYQAQSDHLQQPYQQQSAEQYNAQIAAAEISAQKQQQQQDLVQQQQEQQQQQQEQHQYSKQQEQQQYSQQQQVVQLQQQQREQLKQQQQQAEQQQQQQQDNDAQYQQEHDDYEPRNGDKGSVEQPPAAVPEDEEHDQRKLQSIRDQYYSAVPNEQTASVLAQIAQSAANNDVEVADEPSRVVDAAKPAEKSPPTDQSVQMHTSVQIQQSVPLYEGTYASSRRTNQEYADEGSEPDELMEGSESVAVSESPSSSVNGHAPNQFPYSAAKINAFAAN